MARRRSLARFWRRLGRPSFGRLVTASIALHLAVVVLALWLTERPGAKPPAPPRAPLIVELPPAEPGAPLVRPEARPAPPLLAARPVPPSPPPDRAAAPPPPPPVARPPDAPSPPPPSPPAPVVAAVPASPSPPSPPPAPAPLTPAPAPESLPELAARSPEPDPAIAPERSPEAPASRGPAGPPEAAPPPSWPPAAEAPLAGRGFSLLRPRLEVPPFPGSAPSGGGGTRPEGPGAGESGLEREGQASIPLNTPDPRYADYFLEIKRRIEAHLVYPREAARNNQAGQLLLEFVVKRDGTLQLVELVHSSGVGILDRYSLNTVRFAAPFPRIPERIPENNIHISANFTYVIDRGLRGWGLR